VGGESDWKGSLNEAGRTEGRNAMKDCAYANHVEQTDLRVLAQLQPAAASLGRSAAHPANAFKIPA